ncbi:regucalcin-like [Chrysoperla carnea]|uniref:regucalcin-like n=1 Tax=Chrysoperla carnea TaxID=189513 RepID=UPI001D0882A6|nr:regucalcin-like [Chrysoperla carnea]
MFLFVFITIVVVQQTDLVSSEPTCLLPNENSIKRSDSPPIIIEQVTAPVVHGEEPHWDDEQQVLYFVDVSSQNVLKYDPETGDVTSVHFNGAKAVTPVIPVKDHNNLFAVGVDRRLTLIEWNGENSTVNSQYNNKHFKLLTTVDKSHESNRFNDGKADKNGRLWIGTIGPEDSSGVAPNLATLYRITIKDNFYNDTSNIEVTPVISPVTNSNGLAWNKANNKFYYIDTPTRAVVKFDYDADKGTITNKQVAFDLNKYDLEGFPDGMTIDENDHLWIALWAGGSVIKVNPETNELLQCVAIPAPHVSSTMFGGADLDELYVTTSKRDLTPEQIQQLPQAGSVFRIKNLGVRGYLPPYKVVID